MNRRSRMKSCVAITSLGAAFFLLYAGIIRKLIVDWSNDPNYSHGFLIPFISAYFIWQKRDELRQMVSKPSPWGLLLLFSGLALLLVGTLSGEYFTTRLSMIVVLAGVVAFAKGFAFLRAIAFPFGFLIFMIPLPYLVYDIVAFPLKMIVSKYSVDFLNIIGVPILREGNILHLPQTTLEVADACSGIRSMISLLALSAAMGYIFLNGFVRRAVLVLMAIPIAVLANGVRVIGTGLLAVRYGGRVAEGFFHELAGLVIFGVALVLMGVVMTILGRIGTAKNGAGGN